MCTVEAGRGDGFHTAIVLPNLLVVLKEVLVQVLEGRNGLGIRAVPVAVLPAPAGRIVDATSQAESGGLRRGQRTTCSSGGRMLAPLALPRLEEASRVRFRHFATGCATHHGRICTRSLREQVIERGNGTFRWLFVKTDPVFLLQREFLELLLTVDPLLLDARRKRALDRGLMPGVVPVTTVDAALACSVLLAERQFHLFQL
mmetsp:Transcript_12386/g.30031  ORF Transcript_12386/g.30031 Transcript_12386/m.30031 type:complete len:202 (-) Transcript_12386:2704-3309(-)